RVNKRCRTGYDLCFLTLAALRRRFANVVVAEATRAVRELAIRNSSSKLERSCFRSVAQGDVPSIIFAPGCRRNKATNGRRIIAYAIAAVVFVAAATCVVVVIALTAGRHDRARVDLFAELEVVELSDDVRAGEVYVRSAVRSEAALTDGYLTVCLRFQIPFGF